MDERRYRVALEAISETIENFGEDTILAAFATVAERFGWELTKRDPGPYCCCEYGDFYERENLMAPIHECPSPAPLQVEDLGDPLNDYVFETLLMRSGRWS